MTAYEEKMAANAAARSKRQDPTKIAIRFDPRTARMRGIAAYGNTPFDVPFISHITGNLWQGGCKHGLVLPEEIENLVSLYPWEQYTVNHELHSTLSVVMYDSHDVPHHEVNSIANWTIERMSLGPTLVHCQAGLNRSSLIAARVLMLDGLSADQAITLLRESRSPACLCNPTFESYLRSLFR